MTESWTRLYGLRAEAEVSDTTLHIGERGAVLCGQEFHAKLTITPVPSLATCEGCQLQLSGLPASRIALVNGAPVRRSATWATRLAAEQDQDPIPVSEAEDGGAYWAVGSF